MSGGSDSFKYAEPGLQLAHKTSTNLVNETSRGFEKAFGDTWLGNLGKHWKDMSQKDKDNPNRWMGNTAKTAAAVYGGLEALGGEAGGGAAAAAGGDGAFLGEGASSGIGAWDGAAGLGGGDALGAGAGYATPQVGGLNGSSTGVYSEANGLGGSSAVDTGSYGQGTRFLQGINSLSGNKGLMSMLNGGGGGSGGGGGGSGGMGGMQMQGMQSGGLSNALAELVKEQEKSRAARDRGGMQQQQMGRGLMGMPDDTMAAIQAWLQQQGAQDAGST